MKLLGATLFLLAIFLLVPATGFAETQNEAIQKFPRPLDSYQDGENTSPWEKIFARASLEPFNVVGTGIFILAVCHTFLASRFLSLAHRFEHATNRIGKDQAAADLKTGRKRDRRQFLATVFHFFGEVEAVFGIWLIPLAIAIAGFYGWDTMIAYIDGVNYTEPIFVFVIMAIASTKPVLHFAQQCLSIVAGLGKGTPLAWWLSILTFGPLLGSFITEPAAMTICALLLLDRFYHCKPSTSLKYATLGLLFVNISVGGTLTHFAAPPVVMVASKWNWDLGFMFQNFGWKAIVGIVMANGIFLAAFWKELFSLRHRPEKKSSRHDTPLGITLIHLLAMTWTVVNSHHPAMILLGLLFFIAFITATERHQHPLNLRSPLLVGFFLAALVIHGGCQQWWIAPVLGALSKWPLMIGATMLTAVNDNAAVTYLASLVPNFGEDLKYAVMAGAVVGGGLTVIANAPNPAGQSILQKEFGDGGVKPLYLFAAALIPTVIMGAAFMLL